MAFCDFRYFCTFKTLYSLAPKPQRGRRGGNMMHITITCVVSAKVYVKMFVKGVRKKLRARKYKRYINMEIEQHGTQQ